VALDDVLRFMRLIWAIDHELERVSKRMQDTIGLTIPQRLSLRLIGQNPGILASQLASVLHLSRPTLTGIVQRLEDAGYIERTVDSHDSRRAGLTVTAKGRAANRRQHGTFEEAARRVLATITPAQRAAAGDVLTRLATELRIVGDGLA
jgi:DNA-binding MarR family transcriptional regulator